MNCQLSRRWCSCVDRIMMLMQPLVGAELLLLTATCQRAQSAVSRFVSG